MGKYLTAPVQSSEMPKGIPYIVGNEAAERFSFYGMKTILFVFMTEYLRTSGGEPAFATPTQGREWVSWFVASAYFFPVIGAIISDALIGKYRTILWLSIVYCLGHLSLALIDLPPAMLQATFEPKVWLGVGLSLVAIGSGGIKPCVSANVGDQFGKSNQHLMSKVFGWFYFSINFGSFFSTLLTPWLLKNAGPGWAFGVPGILMGIATIIFWLGRYKFVHIPAVGLGKYVDEFVSGGGFKTLLKLVPIYLFVACFWSLYDQSGSAWVEQANKMNLDFMGITWLESQVQAINPLLILCYIPLFTYLVYPAINKVFPLTPLRKISMGFFLTVLAFGLSAVIEQWIVDGGKPSIAWQILAYVILTAAEVMVSITCLEFSYTQAPPKMKSFIMSMYLLSVSGGNAFTALVNRFTQDEKGNSTLTGASYYWFFTVFMLVAAVLFIGVAFVYKPREYLQDEAAT